MSSRPSFGSKKSLGGHKKSYSAPVSFVAGGVQQAGKPKEECKQNDKGDEEDEKEDVERAAFGRGSSSSRF